MAYVLKSTSEALYFTGATLDTRNRLSNDIAIFGAIEIARQFDDETEAGAVAKVIGPATTIVETP